MAREASEPEVEEMAEDIAAMVVERFGSTRAAVAFLAIVTLKVLHADLRAEERAAHNGA